MMLVRHGFVSDDHLCYSLHGAIWMCRNLRTALGGIPLVLCLFFAVASDQAWGQLRVYGKVDPNTGDPEQKMIFDVNLDSSDNVAPNIVFTSDGTRGYVAYAGSGTILGFSTANGQITARIVTGGKPSASTLLPDGHTIAVVSTQDSRIFLVDMDTDSVVGTYSFDQAIFGFGSVLALSPDGSTGYVSSTGTSEVIKFSMADGHELARLGGIAGPCRITVSPDGSTLMVVDAIKEYLVFVNAANLTIKTKMTGEAGTAVNFTITSNAVLSQDGQTGIITSSNPISIYGIDTVYLFNVSTGERLNSINVGSLSIFTGITPDGKYWIVLCSLGLWKIPTTDFASASEMPTPATQTVIGSNVVFSPDSHYAYFTASSNDKIYQQDISLGTLVGQAAVGDPGDTGVDQASSLGITPDGKSLAVVDFTINVLDLVQGASSLDSATFDSSTTRFSGVSVVNVSGASNRITFSALNVYGEVITGDGVTNPVEYNLAPNKQVSMTLEEMFHYDTSVEKAGWLSVLTSSPQTVGYLTMGDTNLSRLDAAPLFSKPLTDWIVPDIAKGSGVSVELDITNPDYYQTTYDATRYDSSGSVAEQVTDQVAYPTNRMSRIVSDMFPKMTDGTTGYVRITTPGNLLCTEFSQTSTALGALNGIQVSDFAGIKTIYSPQFVVGYGYETILNVINASSNSADITVTLYNSNGSTVGSPYRTTLAANAQLKDDLATIFKGNSAVSNVTGWLQVQSSQDRVLGSITFTSPAGKFLTTLQLLGTPSTDFIFPVLAQTDVYETGIALLNANPAPATVTLEVWNTNGTMTASTSFDLGAKSQVAEYLNHYLPNMGQMSKGNIRIHSTGSLFGMALIHDQGFNFMTAVPSFPLP
jgi:sugar lactone lactonase YvrE